MLDSDCKNAKILIVDDNEANIDLLEDYLDTQGYVNIKSTKDPREVVHLFASFDPDILLLDLAMPHLTGFEVMEQISSLISEHTFIPILVLTADMTSEAKEKALSGGATDFLVKPFDLTEVGLRINNLLTINYLHQRLQKQAEELEEAVDDRTASLNQKMLELKEAKELAEAGEKLKSAFINNISHEIRTPLNGILGFANIMCQPSLSSEDRKEFMNILDESSNRLIETVTKFMDISIIRSSLLEVNKKLSNFSTIVSDVVDKYFAAANEKGLRIDVDLTEIDDTHFIFTDSELLKKVINHILDNSVKFTERGKIEIKAHIKVDEIIISVSDTGIGIHKERLSQIYEDFIQIEMGDTRKYEGNGLGLSISKGIIEQLEGKIFVESEIDKGTKVQISIPNTLQKEKSLLVNDSNLSDEARTYTILVAEDDDINFLYITTLLKMPNVKTIRAKNGHEAIKYCELHPEIDLVLMDLKMPLLDGFEASKRIKNKRPELVIIAVTAYSSKYDRLKANESGCDDIIIKPLRKETLIEKIIKFGIRI